MEAPGENLNEKMSKYDNEIGQTTKQIVTFLNGLEESKQIEAKKQGAIATKAMLLNSPVPASFKP